MGLLGAFATGMVKGFTQNIKEEKAKRLADEQNLKTLEGAVIQASLSGDDYIAQNGDAVMKAIKAARGELNEKEAIDLFGTETPRVNIDETKLLGKLVSPENAADKTPLYKVTRFGSEVQNAINMYVPKEMLNDENEMLSKKRFTDEGANNDLSIFDALYLNMQKLGKQDEFDRIMNSQETQDALYSNYELAQNLTLQFLNSVGKDKSIIGDMKPFVLNNVPTADWMPNYFGSGSLYDFNSKTKFLKKSENQQDNLNEDKVIVNPSFSSKKIINNKQLFTLSFEDLGLSDENSDAPAYKKEMEIMSMFANQAGMKYSKGYEFPVRYLINRLSYNTDLAGDQGVDYLKSSIQHMINVGNIILDNRNSSTDPINLDKLTNRQSAELGKYLATADINEDGKPDFGNDVFAQASFLQNLIFDKTVDRLNDKVKNPETFKTYSNVTPAEFSNLFESYTGYKLAGFQTKKAAEERSLELVEELERLQGKVPFGSGGLLEGFSQRFQTAFGKDGFFNVVQDMISGSEGITFYSDEEQEKFRQRLSDIQAKGNATIETRKRQTFQLLLAAELARAEDPSGRLSDADFARNLEKVRAAAGASPSQQSAPLQAIKSDLLRMRERHNEIDGIRVNFLNSGRITHKTLKYLKAINLGRKFKKNAVDITSGVTGTGSADQILPTEQELTAMNDITADILEFNQAKGYDTTNFPNFMIPKNHSVYQKQGQQGGIKNYIINNNTKQIYELPDSLMSYFGQYGSGFDFFKYLNLNKI